MNERVFEMQRQARDSVKSLQAYLTDLQNWEAEMKRKEAALQGQFEQDLPPVRSKVKKEKPVVPPRKQPQKRISSFDYNAWDKFDVDRACETVDMEDVGPQSLDGKKSQQAKLEKLREEALYEKEKGNTYVKNQKWDDAIACYSRAIDLVKDNAIYYANRGLCHLMKDSLHQAEKDCTQALNIDPSYVKALQRRATAREKLGSLKAASHDLNEVLKLEPHNVSAKKQLQAIKARMGTKGAKSKSSPTTTPSNEAKRFIQPTSPKIIELDDQPSNNISNKVEESQLPIELSPIEKWKAGIGEDVTIIESIEKPPHLRSKKPLKRIGVREIGLGDTAPLETDKPTTRMKIIEIEDGLAQGDTNNNKNQNHNNVDHAKVGDGDKVSSQMNGIHSPESEKLSHETQEMNKKNKMAIEKLQPPANSVQFMSEWKHLRGLDEARCHYLSLIDPLRLPQIFSNALESDVLCELLHILKDNKQKFREKTITAYLKGLTAVKRFSALAMFLSTSDKELIHKLLVHCRTVEGCSDEDIEDLKNKFEL